MIKPVRNNNKKIIINSNNDDILNPSNESKNLRPHIFQKITL